MRLRALDDREDAWRIGSGRDDGRREELMRTGSVTSCVRSTVPAAMVTLATGTRASESDTSAVAACAP